MSSTTVLEPRLFDFHDRAVRTVVIDGVPWFVAMDVAKVLGYRLPEKAIRDHCTGAVKRKPLTPGDAQEMLLIQDSDVYRLIMHSTLPLAEKFQDWVYEEVLPQVCKTGGYVIPGREEEFLKKEGRTLLLDLDDPDDPGPRPCGR